MLITLAMLHTPATPRMPHTLLTPPGTGTLPAAWQCWLRHPHWLPVQPCSWLWSSRRGGQSLRPPRSSSWLCSSTCEHSLCPQHACFILPQILSYFYMVL